MEYIDARRLTGPNLLQQQPGSILDIRCTQAEAKALLPFWESRVREMCDAIGWQKTETAQRYLTNGLSLAFTAAIDALYSATEINEWAWSCCDGEFNHKETPDFGEALKRIRQELRKEANPQLRKLKAAAVRHGTSFLWDDDEASIGMGGGSGTWPVRQLPDSKDIDWSAIHDIPTALVTGTNGKTTTVRLARHIARGFGKNVGLSSTDWIAVNDDIIDRGDWSGPGGARQVLRQPGIDLAILETARGGLLRRGLGLEKADAALITNVAEDHLGDFGSQTLDELVDVKWIVSRAVEKDGTLILNADDSRLVKRAKDYRGTIVWFGLDHKNQTIRKHTAKGGKAFVCKERQLTRIEGKQSEPICDAASIPITLDGTASHNVANALAAAALTHCLGVPAKHIGEGLISMSQEDNPGRSNLYAIKDFKVLVDFAHNPHAMQAVFKMAKAIPAKRRLLAFGQAGDRTDKQIRELARSAWRIGLDTIHISELETYARGRSRGEVFTLIFDELIRIGARRNQILHFDHEIDALNAALNRAQANDLIIMLALSDRDAIQDRLKKLTT